MERPKPAALIRGRSIRGGKSEDQSGEFKQGLGEYPGEYSEEVGETEETMVKAAACQPMTRESTARNIMRTASCRRHNRVNCPQCFDIPAPVRQCQALIAICQNCGQHHPVVADACQSQDKSRQMPVTKGTIERQTGSVLRDTGCSTVVVRRLLVPDDKITDRVETCIFIDGTDCRTPVAEVHVDTPYFLGPTSATCMENSLYDLIISNNPGV